jgi:rubrerythrin
MRLGVSGDDSFDPASSRRALLVGTVVFGTIAAVPLAGRLLRLGNAGAAPSKSRDAQILQLVLQLEHTQVGFYEEALRDAGLTGELREFASSALAHERQHLAVIRKALGAKAGPKPVLEFGAKTKSAPAFTKAAIALEDTAVAAYNGQATNLTKGTLAAAAEIVSVEARHAAWIRDIGGVPPAGSTTDVALDTDGVRAALRRAGLLS